MPLLLAGLLFVGAPILEIAVLILVGERIGLLATLGIVVFSAVLGAVLLKRQGFAALARMKAEARAGRVPGRDMGHAVMIAIAGILLVLPGLVGDVVGLLLFVPPVRDLVWRALGRSVTVVVARPNGGFTRPGAPARPGVLDLSDADFRRQDDAKSPFTGRGTGPATGRDSGDDPTRTLH